MDALSLVMYVPWTHWAWWCMYHGLTELGHVCTMGSPSLVMYVPWAHWAWSCMYHGLTELGRLRAMDSLTCSSTYHESCLSTYHGLTYMCLSSYHGLTDICLCTYNALTDIWSSTYHGLTDIWSSTYHGLTEIWDSRTFGRVRTISWLTWDLTMYIGLCPRVIYIPWMSFQVIVAPEAIVVTGSAGYLKWKNVTCSVVAGFCSWYNGSPR